MVTKQIPLNEGPEKGRNDGIELLAFILDDFIRIPGTQIRIGLDPIIGLIPGVGDVLSSLLSYVIVYRAAQLGAPALTIAAMVKNILLDSLVGMFPLVGDIFDFAFHSNRRNVELLKSFQNQNAIMRPERSGTEIRKVLLVIAGCAALSTVFFVFITILLLKGLFKII